MPLQRPLTVASGPPEDPSSETGQTPGRGLYAGGWRGPGGVGTVVPQVFGHTRAAHLAQGGTLP
jgi:hypothetical protein